MKNIIIIFLMIVTAIFFGSTAIKGDKKQVNPFDTLKYDSVVGYDYNGTSYLEIVINGELLSKKGRILQQKQLTKPQIEQLNKTLGDKKSYGSFTAACFDPHVGFVFYKEKKIAGYISICLACNFLKSSAKIPAESSHKSKDCDGCYDIGFSKSGRSKISALVKELGFSHWELNSEMFDK